MPLPRINITAERFYTNLEQAAQLSDILLPAEYFSTVLADYCNELALQLEIHTISVPIVLFHLTATTSQQSFVWRSSKESVPLNLYSLIFARPAFGKSKILRIITKCLDIICDYMPNNFEPSSNINEGTNTTPYYHDATTAGIITAAANSTKLFIAEEADIVLNQMSAFPQPAYSSKQVPRPQTDARHLLIKLYDGDPHIRQLKNSATSRSLRKHNVLGSSTGQIIEQQLELKQNGSHTDALFERFLLWPLNPKPLMMTSHVYTIDNKKNPSLEQFSIILALLSNIHLSFTDDAQEAMIALGNQLATTAYLERNDRALSGRIGKMYQNTLRVVGIIQLLECAYKVAQQYLIINYEFPNKITDKFIYEIRSHVIDLYPLPLDDNLSRIRIDIEVVNRGINVMESLLEQYKLLMYIPQQMSTFRVSTINPPMTSSQIIQAQDISVGKKLDQLHIRQILLFESVIFSPKTILNKISSIRHNCKHLHTNLQKLTTMGLLLFFDNGTIAKTKKAQIYIKRFPDPTNIIDQQNHEALLAQFNDHLLSAATFRSSTTKAYVLTKSPLRPEIYQVLQSSAYSSFNFDLSEITQQNQIIPNINHHDQYSIPDDSTTSSTDTISLHMPETNMNQIPLQNILSSISPTTDNSMVDISSSVQNSARNSLMNIENPDVVIALLQQIEHTHTNQRSLMNVDDVSVLPSSSVQQTSTYSRETLISSTNSSSIESGERKKRKTEINKKVITKRINTHTNHGNFDVNDEQKTINESQHMNEQQNNINYEQHVCMDPQYVEDNQQHATSHLYDNLSTDDDESLIHLQNKAKEKKQRQKKTKTSKQA